MGFQTSWEDSLEKTGLIDTHSSFHSMNLSNYKFGSITIPPLDPSPFEDDRSLLPNCSSAILQRYWTLWKKHKFPILKKIIEVSGSILLSLETQPQSRQPSIYQSVPIRPSDSQYFKT